MRRDAGVWIGVERGKRNNCGMRSAECKVRTGSGSDWVVSPKLKIVSPEIDVVICIGNNGKTLARLGTQTRQNLSLCRDRREAAQTDQTRAAFHRTN